MYRLLAAALFCFIVIVIGNVVIVAQSTVSGKWSAGPAKDSESEIQLNVWRETSKSKRYQMGQTYKIEELRGLSISTVKNGGSARFSLEREAGNIDFDGSFSGSKGEGTFVFTPSQTFAAAMKTRGFDFDKSEKNYGDSPPENRYFTAALLNVTTALADDLLSADFGKLETEDLFGAAIFKIDSAFLREMKAAGFKNLTFGDLIKARIFKIDGDFLRELAQNGLDNEPFENVVKMKIFKITPDFIKGVRAEGFDKIDIEDLVKMRIFNIDAEFIRRARAEGVPMEVEKLVEMRIGVRVKVR